MTKSEITSMTTKTKHKDINTHPINSQKITSLSSNRQILSEEIYTSTLQSIITRDYFPAIPSLQRDTAILAARAEGDTAKAVAIRRAARLLDQQRQLELNNDDESNIHPTTKLLKQTVDGFHKYATSEDNEEFEQTQADEISKHRLWIQNIFAPKINNALENGNHMDDSVNLLASDEFNATPAYEKKKLLLSDSNMKYNHDDDQSNKQSNLIHIDKNPIASNSFFFTPLHSKTIQNEYLHFDDKTNLKHLTYDLNQDPKQLMPPPPPMTSGNSNHINTILSKKDNEKCIQASQTRFPYQAISSLPPTSCILSDEQKNAMDNNIDNVPSALLGSGYDTTVSTDLDASPTTSITHERKQRQAYLEKNSYTYVHLTPLVKQKDQSSSNTKQEHTSTLRKGTKTLNTPHKNKIRKKSSSSKHSKSSSKRGSSSFVDRTASLTPAAQSLLRRSLNPGKNGLNISSSLIPKTNMNARDSGAFGSVLRQSYSSTPRHQAKRKKSIPGSGKRQTVSTPRINRR